LETRAEKSHKITPLVLVPEFVKGLELYHDRILTVIDLQNRVIGQAAKSGDQMLVAEIRDQMFGFEVQADRGTLKKEEYTIRPMPPIVQSSWLRSAIEHDGEILPLIDMEALLSCKQIGAIEQPLPERYAPDMSFLSLFGKQDTEVVEISLLGQHYAIPKSEMKDTIGFKPYRAIPNVPEIVIGVTEENGEILPVLDLAMVYGRRSLVTPEWRMIKIVNGDFHALVITEAVYAERRLPLNIQREVPIKLPYAVVYGCYPDADSVRLILNVEALTVYFEKALVQELVPSMTPGMMQARAEIVPSLLGELLATTTNVKEVEEHVVEQEATPAVLASQSEEIWATEAELEPELEPEPQIITAAILNLEDIETITRKEDIELPNAEQIPGAGQKSVVS
jgi:chemotaxis signal transduction protein